MNKYVIIVAGGSGKRMKTNIPKQFIEIKGMPLLMHTMTTFYKYDNKINIILVLSKAYFKHWKDLCQCHGFQIPHEVVEGGEERYHSVKNGLSVVKGQGLVGIHDGVRPLVSPATIDRCYTVALEKGNAIPCIPVIESLRFADELGSRPVDRNNYHVIQTPQVFQSGLLQDAYDQPFSKSFTDDASVIETMGHGINLVEGNRENIKITTPLDLELAKVLLS